MATGEPIGVAFVEVRPEIEDFRGDAEADLQAAIGDQTVAVRGEVELAGIDQARADISALSQEARDAVGELAIQTSPEFARGFIAGAEEAVQAAIEFGDATDEINQNIITGEAARRSLTAANLAAAASEDVLAGATKREAAAAIEADAAERDLIRTRSRRSSSLGPLRFAGVGLGAGVALFSATQALRALGDGLQVTGNEALTFEGRMRNLGSALLSGDIVGGFRALTNETREYSAAQVLVIDTSAEVEERLKSLGATIDDLPGLEASRLRAAEQFTQIPQFLQTRIAQTRADGDTAGQLQALRRAQEELHEQEQAIRDLNLDQAQTNVALEAVFQEQANIASQIANLTKQARPDILAPLVEAVTDARLSGDQAKILAALRAEAAALEAVIASAKTNAADRERFKNELIQVNQDIESTQDAIVAEVQRHQQAMLDKLLDIGVLEDLEAQVAGSPTGAGRARRAAAIQATLNRGTLNGKKLTRAQKELLNQELIAINAEIEAEQDAINAEAERHAREAQRQLEEQDEAFLRGLQGPERRARNRQLQAAATAALNDDIRASEALQRVYRQQIAVARRRIRDKQLRDATIDALTDQLLAEERNERDLRRQNRRERVERERESIDLDIQLAQANENIAAEIRAHRAKIRFLQERIRNTREGTNQRKRLRVEIANERAEIRRLQEEAGDRGGSGANLNELALSLLQELQGFSSNLASNVLPGNFTLSPSVQASPTIALRRPPTAPRAGDPFTFVPSPFEDNRGGRGRPDAQAAQGLRESQGAPATAGQMEVLINVGRTTNRLLGDIKRGVGHTEAKTARDLNRYRGGTVDVM